MPQNDSGYGGSKFRKFPTISSRLRTIDGAHKPRSTREQKRSKGIEPPGVIKRGDKSGTLWERRKKGQFKDNGHIQSSNPGDEAFSIGNEQAELETELCYQELADQVNEGSISVEEAFEMADDLEALLEQDQSPIIRS